MVKHISTREVCAAAGVSESGLRHILRRPGAPRPQLHPSARLFLWDESDVHALIEFIAKSKDERVLQASRRSTATTPPDRSAYSRE
jgi:hypothetical protein